MSSCQREPQTPLFNIYYYSMYIIVYIEINAEISSSQQLSGSYNLVGSIYRSIKFLLLRILVINLPHKIMRALTCVNTKKFRTRRAWVDRTHSKRINPQYVYKERILNWFSISIDAISAIILFSCRMESMRSHLTSTIFEFCSFLHQLCSWIFSFIVFDVVLYMLCARSNIISIIQYNYWNLDKWSN